MLFCFAFGVGSLHADNGTIRLYLFWQEGCSVCEKMKPFLEQLTKKNPELVLVSEKVGRTLESIQGLRRAVEKFGIDTPSVPAVFIGPRFWIGYNDAIADEIARVVEECLADGCIDAMTDPLPEAAESTAPVMFDSRLFGSVDLNTLPLMVSTALIALLDGVNPCSVWVLTFLLGMVVHTGSRGRVMLVGLVFLAITSLVYGLFIVGVVRLMTIVVAARWIRFAVVLLALAMGVINVKDYFALGSGVSLTISDGGKRRIGVRARALAGNNRTAISLMISTILLAAGIAVVELPCTAGFPIIWSNFISSRELAFPTFMLLLALYLVVYLIDEIAIVFISAATLGRIAMGEKRGRYLKLAGGVLMIVLSAVLAVRHDLMESLWSVLLVFAGSAGLVLLVLSGERVYRRFKTKKDAAFQENDSGEIEHD